MRSLVPWKRGFALSLLLIASGIYGDLPSGTANASVPTCPSGFCSGADSNTAYNYQGSSPQLYIGEVGTYYRDFTGAQGPCPSDINESCFDSTGAASALSLYESNQGLGVQFYYLGGGADLPYALDYGSYYCFGWEQGYLAELEAVYYHASYVDANEFLIMALDVEGYESNGWSEMTRAQNRDVFDGFRDYLLQRSSADPAHCDQSPGIYYIQQAAYSSPTLWSYSFGPQAQYYSISQTPVWTNEYCCESYPGNYSMFEPFGDSSYYLAWQFYGGLSADYDISEEPVYLPAYGAYLGQ